MMHIYLNLYNILLNNYKRYNVTDDEVSYAEK